MSASKPQATSAPNSGQPFVSSVSLMLPPGMGLGRMQVAHANQANAAATTAQPNPYRSEAERSALINENIILRQMISKWKQKWAEQSETRIMQLNEELIAKNEKLKSANANLRGEVDLAHSFLTYLSAKHSFELDAEIAEFNAAQAAPAYNPAYGDVKDNSAATSTGNAVASGVEHRVTPPPVAYYSSMDADVAAAAVVSQSTIAIATATAASTTANAAAATGVSPTLSPSAASPAPDANAAASAVPLSQSARVRVRSRHNNQQNIRGHKPQLPPQGFIGTL